MRSLHLADTGSRDAFVRFVSLKSPPPPERVVDGHPVNMRRFLAAGEKNTHEALFSTHGQRLGQVLIDSDPEVDLELIGRPVERTSTVYLDSDQQMLRVAPELIELILDPFGEEKERRIPVERLPNISEELPVRFTRTRLSRDQAIRRFIFSRSLQLWHTDGITYEFLHGIAADLHSTNEMVLLAGGEKAKDPLIFQLNGLPWRAFLEGRVNNEGYCLLMRLSNLELKALPTKP